MVGSIRSIRLHGGLWVKKLLLEWAGHHGGCSWVMFFIAPPRELTYFGISEYFYLGYDLTVGAS